MATINLLPWREERRQQRKKEFFVLLGVFALLGVGLVLLADIYVSSQISSQQRRNDHLTTNIRKLDQQVAEIRDLQRRRTQLLDRMQVIQELQGNRPVIVRVMDQFVRTMPDGIYYTNLASRSGRIEVSGVAESNNRVSSLMRQMDASDWLKDPNLSSVRANPEFGDQATTFRLMVQVQLPSANDSEGAR
jgi:type IV pilus assembly protein PilN